MSLSLLVAIHFNSMTMQLLINCTLVLHHDMDMLIAVTDGM